jgi:hypothetical protein
LFFFAVRSDVMILLDLASLPPREEGNAVGTHQITEERSGLQMLLTVNNNNKNNKNNKKKNNNNDDDVDFRT